MILDKIVDNRKKRIAERKSQTPLADIKRAAENQTAPRDFAAALKRDTISLIAEVKRASPSKGLLHPNLVASSLAQTYSQNGAAAISVLTEPDYFLGSFDDLEAARADVGVPVLCKDFIIDSYQIYEARSHGADAVLLISAILGRNELHALMEAAHSLGMAALVEVHNREELMIALDVSPRIIGINNRNLADFSVDLETTFSLRPLIPPNTVIVSESGIHTRDDVVSLQNAGVDAILVGEALVTHPQPAAKIDELLGQIRHSAR